MPDQPERRANCQAHEQNTRDLAANTVALASLKGSLSTIKWLWPVIFGVISAIIGFTIAYVLSDIKDSLIEIKCDIKDMKASAAVSAIENAETRFDVNQLKKDVSDMRFSITRLHNEQD